MKIHATMNLGELAEHMGPEATEAEAMAMRGILIDRGLDGTDTGDVDPTEWEASLGAAERRARCVDEPVYECGLAPDLGGV